MNDSLFAVSLIGGIAVLLSYAYLFYDDDSDKAWGGHRGRPATDTVGG